MKSRREGAVAVGGVVLLLRRAGVVEREVGEVRRRVAGDAVARARREIPRIAVERLRQRLAQEDLQAFQLVGPEDELLVVLAELAVLGSDEPRRRRARSTAARSRRL